VRESHVRLRRRVCGLRVVDALLRRHVRPAQLADPAQVERGLLRVCLGAGPSRLGGLELGLRLLHARRCVGIVQLDEQVALVDRERVGVPVEGVAGLGVRALIGSSWGFFAVAEPSEASARQAGFDAAEIAKASALVPGPPLELADLPALEAALAAPRPPGAFVPAYQAEAARILAAAFTRPSPALRVCAVERGAVAEGARRAAALRRSVPLRA
jgi:hypothetical protein